MNIKCIVVASKFDKAEKYFVLFFKHFISSNYLLFYYYNIFETYIHLYD